MSRIVAITQFLLYLPISDHGQWPLMVHDLNDCFNHTHFQTSSMVVQSVHAEVHANVGNDISLQFTAIRFKNIQPIALFINFDYYTLLYGDMLFTLCNQVRISAPNRARGAYSDLPKSCLQVQR